MGADKRCTTHEVEVTADEIMKIARDKVKQQTGLSEADLYHWQIEHIRV